MCDLRIYWKLFEQNWMKQFWMFFFLFFSLGKLSTVEVYFLFFEANLNVLVLSAFRIVIVWKLNVIINFNLNDFEIIIVWKLSTFDINYEWFWYNNCMKAGWDHLWNPARLTFYLVTTQPIKYFGKPNSDLET